MESVAIIGMSGRFPGASDVDAFWRNLKAGVDSISRFESSDLEIGGVDDATEPGHVRARGIIEDIEMFDARFFGFLPPEAELMDPQQRVFLELAWQAVEHAGYDVQRYPGSVGVFAGCFMNSYLLANLCSRGDFLARLVESIQTDALQIEMGNEKDHLATHTAFRLGLRGPAMTLQTACSTSLVAAATACRSLLARECDMALAGGVTIVVPQKRGYVHKEGSILSADGVCRPFDVAASGTVFSNGAGVLVLKRVADALADGDTIYAVIRGAAVNNDGNRKVNYTAPSAAGQVEVVGRALAAAGVDARSIGYVEAHGTATPVGDPIEISGLTTAYRAMTLDTGFCALGSVKANIGHLDVATGAASLIKVALSLHEGVISPLIHFTSPNPRIDLANSPFYINTELRRWDAGASPRRAGVSSYGIGGTNAHLILEEAPPCAATRVVPPVRSRQLLLLSARTESALATQAERLAAHLESGVDQDPADIAFTLQVGRRQFDQRRFVVAGNREELIAKLRSPASPDEAGTVGALRPPVVFMFPDHGSQYPGMGRDLYHDEPAFRDIVDRCADALARDRALGRDLREYLLWTPEDSWTAAEIGLAMAEPSVAQSSTFVMEIALGRLLLAWGIKPATLVGHGVGEYAAACLAGAFEIEDAVRLVAARGRLVQSHASASPVFVEALQAAIGRAGSGPSELVIHSTGLARPLTAEELRDPAYWMNQVTMPVRLADTIAGAAAKGRRVFLEMGPGNVLSTFCRQAPEAARSLGVFPCLGPDDDRASSAVGRIMATLGRLWICGVVPDWEAVHGGKRRRVPLPTYPFERKRFWLDAEVRRPVSEGSRTPEPVSSSPPRSNPQVDAERLIAGIWSRLLGVEHVDVNDNFFDLGGHSLLVATAVAEIRKQTGVKLTPSRFAFETMGQLAASVAAEPGLSSRPGLLKRLFGKRAAS